jgi:fucose permease
MALGLAVLVAWPGGWASVGAAFAVGFGAGPVYPLLIAMVLRRRETQGIFVLAGAGASAVPLMTGAVSGWLHSLSAGLCVPLAAAGVMAVLAMRVTSTEAIGRPTCSPELLADKG